MRNGVTESPRQFLFLACLSRCSTEFLLLAQHKLTTRSVHCRVCVCPHHTNTRNSQDTVTRMCQGGKIWWNYWKMWSDEMCQDAACVEYYIDTHHTLPTTMCWEGLPSIENKHRGKLAASTHYVGLYPEQTLLFVTVGLNQIHWIYLLW